MCLHFALAIVITYCDCFEWSFLEKWMHLTWSLNISLLINFINIPPRIALWWLLKNHDIRRVQAWYLLNKWPAVKRCIFAVFFLWVLCGETDHLFAPIKRRTCLIIKLSTVLWRMKLLSRYILSISLGREVKVCNVLREVFESIRLLPTCWPLRFVSLIYKSCFSFS